MNGPVDLVVINLIQATLKRFDDDDDDDDDNGE